MQASIKLFKALEIQTKKKKAASTDFLKTTLKYGVVFAPEVIANYEEKELSAIARELGSNSEKLNNVFHKSWTKIKDSSIEQLVLEQLIHYITTYGLESVDMYSKDTIFIPAEKLEAIKTSIELIYIKGLTHKELQDKLEQFLQSGIALSEDTISDVVSMAKTLDLTSVEGIKNKEVKIILGAKLGMIPIEPTEFLRMLIYIATKKTLLIKSQEAILALKSAKNSETTKLLVAYQQRYGLESLAQIFYRFKPLFLAMKIDKVSANIINKIRKLAVEFHKPMNEDYLNSITANIEHIDEDKLREALSKANIFRKIRLAYALKFRTGDSDSIMYRIRNGKSYSTEFNYTRQAQAKKVLDIVLPFVIADLNVKGKKIYIPKYITYALPSSEKQFTGPLPSGTYIDIPKHMVVGVHWEDVKDQRIDLDLSMLSLDGKIGWDRNYRNDGGTVLFSGDMTAAPKPLGASEFMYVQKQSAAAYIVNINYFNYDKAMDVPFKIIVASEQVKDFKSNYLLNPNNILAIVDTKITQRQKILGLLVVTTGGCRFYFAESDMGNKISATNNESTEHARKHLYTFYKNSIRLNEILELAGATIVSEPDKLFDIDLSPEKLSKDTIISLLTSR